MRERNYGVDLLRLVLMYMVCLLHTLGQGGILSAAPSGSLNYALFWLLNVFSYCAVDAFAMISGYTASSKPQRYVKIVDMWFQVFFYSFVLTALAILSGLFPGLDEHALIKGALPVCSRVFWYFSAYFALFFAMPVLDRFVFSLDEAQAGRALIVVCVLFSGLGIVGDPFGTQAGYSALWLMVLYFIGALMRRARLFEQRSSGFLIVIWMLCVLCAWALKVTTGIDRLASYVSPTVVLSAMLMVLLFARLDQRPRVIAPLVPLAFGVYLFHSSQPVWSWMSGRFAFAAAMNPVLGVPAALGCALGVFTCGLAVEFLRQKLYNALCIHTLSQRITNAAGKVLTRLLKLTH